MPSGDRRQFIASGIKDMFLAFLFAMVVGLIVLLTQGLPYYDRDFLETYIPATATLLGFVGAILAIVFPALRRPVSQIEHQIQKWTRVKDELERGESEARLEQIAGQLPWYVLSYGTGPIRQRVAMYLDYLRSNALALRKRYLRVLLELISSAMILTLALVLAVLHLKLLSAWSFANLTEFGTVMSGVEMGFLVFSTVSLVAGLYRSAEMAG